MAVLAAPLHHGQTVSSSFFNIELRVQFRAQGFRWPLRASDQVEVWRGPTLLGEISGGLIHHLLAHYLASAALQQRFSAELAGLVPTVLEPAREEAQVPAERRADLRIQRRSRRRRPL